MTGGVETKNQSLLLGFCALGVRQNAGRDQSGHMGRGEVPGLLGKQKLWLAAGKYQQGLNCSRGTIQKLCRKTGGLVLLKMRKC